ncbi:MULTISPECIES: RimK/LysX family protein [Microbacterium]|uniref:ATP-dependent zinc protease family protein n=1 Tax=Microbacterium TaxID=33882 RepID=UPI001E3A12C1|nr:RimK/LysX family protein [Microbacterium nymphoidis]MCD2497008.1 RimK/LysX family protein [Microbacterium nymphoidis]
MGSGNSITVTGWREWVSLAGIELPWIKAKIDTGARTSSLHAFDIVEFDHEGREWVRFAVHPWQFSDADAQVVELPIHDRRDVRSSSGHVERRIVVIADLRLVGVEMPVELTLTNRAQMGFRMLIGREALRNGFLVDSARSFVGGKPSKRVRLANRGKTF